MTSARSGRLRFARSSCRSDLAALNRVSATARPAPLGDRRRGFATSRTSLPSTVIRAFAYDPTEHRLDIEFVSGRHYSYLDVPEREAEAMRQAPSKGSYFNRRIRNRYRFVERRG